jgi:hypothetical protein
MRLRLSEENWQAGGEGNQLYQRNDHAGSNDERRDVTSAGRIASAAAPSGGGSRRAGMHV